MQKFKHDRPTIGILPGWSGLAGTIPDRYLASVLKGIQSAAVIKDCHLLLAWGLGRVTDVSGTFPAWPVIFPDTDFVPVGHWNTDGLIVFAPLRHEGRSQYLQELSDNGFPVIYIATGERDPMISVDNEGGIRQAVAHLINHGHRDIAFIAGDPSDKGDSESRLIAFQSAIIEHGLQANPALIAQGWHTFSGGHQAAQQLINSGVKFTALLSSDDNSAIGAMRAIREAGLQIPRDIAVIGFDDQPDAVAQVPPLASIHVPLAAIGEQALTLMIDHLINGYELESIRIPTRLVPRQSCGCMPQIVSLAGKSGPSSQTFASHSDLGLDDINRIKQKLVIEMTATLPSRAHFPFGERTHRLCTTLLEAFYISLKDNSSANFQVTLMEILQELELSEDNIDSWQSVVSTLRREMTQLPAIWGKAGMQNLAEDMLHEARAAISESAQRQDDRHQFQREIASQALSELTALLIATLDERQAVQALEGYLATIGIRHARVALFEAEEDDPVAWSKMLSSDVTLKNRRFPSREFPPDGLYASDELLNLALVPLVFQDEALGYVAFDASNLGPCAIIARQLAATFKASRLYAQTIELSLTDALTNVFNRRYFDIFLNNEVDRSLRFRRDLAIIILDIDHFKEYNDTFGHPAGDKALQLVAQCIQKERRSADVVARIGGEEFAIILPETEMGGALQVAEKIRAAMTNLSELKSPLTLSMGISLLQGADIEVAEFVQQADLALYEAKRMGRNRIRIFEDKE
jgi:diguanylate cyclase (GGDEF)-like protein